MVTDDEIETVLKTHCLSLGYKRLPRGHFRVNTKLLYPDGASIGVFVDRGDPTKPNGVTLSDFGGTFAKLLEYQVDPMFPTRLQTIQETVSAIGVRVTGDRLVFEVNEAVKIPDGVISLSQACLRASCLIFTRRTSPQRSFADEIRAVVKATNLPFEEKYPFNVPNFRPITVDYRVKGPNRHSSILTLGTSHAQANEVLRKWFDLKRSNVGDRLVTVFDERRDLEQKEDLIRLGDISDVISLSNHAGLEMLLKAA